MGQGHAFGGQCGSEILMIYEAVGEQFKANSTEMSETSAPQKQAKSKTEAGKKVSVSANRNVVRNGSYKHGFVEPE